VRDRIVKRDSWRDVKISCDKPRVPVPPEVPIKYEAPRLVTEMKVKQMMKTQFPDGPRTAQQAQAAHWRWQLENRDRAWNQQTHKNALAERWQFFYDSVFQWAMGEEDRGVMHGHFDYGGVDFNGLDRPRSRGRSL
jgi:hypothetical protein